MPEELVQPEHPGKDATAQAKWVYLTRMILWLAKHIPCAAEPDYLRFPYADEGHKERSERYAVENNAADETRTALEEFLESDEWPQTTETAAFFVHERLEFAANMTAALATEAADSTGKNDPVPLPRGTVKGIIRWLAVDVYEAGHFPRHRWCNDSSDREY